MISQEPSIKVAYCDIDTYNQELVDKAVQSMMDSLGGIEQYVKPTDKVMLKANLVRDMHPDLAGTTHPSVLIAIARLIHNKCGAKIIIADSSGGAYTKTYMNIVYNKCRMTDVIGSTDNCQLNHDFDYCNVPIDGVQIKNIDIINAFFDADVVINVGKLKMHSFAGYTGAVKNLFGLIPGLVKVEVHSRYPHLNEFCDALIDIEQFSRSKVKLHIVDAIVGMEGAGPTNGKPRAIGKLFAATNPYLLDYVANSLYCDPMSQPLLAKARQRDLLPLDKLDFDLTAWKEHYIKDFETVQCLTTNSFLHLPKWIALLLKNNLTQKVKIRKNICRACRKCVDHCPNKALSIVNNKAHITQRLCIRCYCCQELCPFDAVGLSKPIVYKVARRLSSVKKTKMPERLDK